VRGPSALACPSSLKGVLGAFAAAKALAAGLRAGGVFTSELPVADGGEGTAEALAAARGGTWHEADVGDAFGRPRLARWLELDDGTAVVESAEAIPLDPSRLDALAASSRGLGELILAATAAGPHSLLVCLGGTANVDGGAGLREVVRELPGPTRVACDVASPLLDAARVFARQKGATEEQARELETLLAAMAELTSYAELPGAGAAGGLGAALAALGAELVPGAALVLESIAFDPRPFGLVVTGEGTVDATTTRGKAPGEIARRCVDAGVRCVVFGGRVVEPVAGVETVALSGDPRRARDDLRELGERLGRELVVD
jgi:glycerate kinase